MAHTSAATYRNVLTGQTNHTLTFSTVLDHETLTLLFQDRTGGAVIDSISDGAGGTWTQRSTHTTAGGILTRVYVREDAAAATNLVVTIVTTASLNSQLVGRRIASDSGGVVYPTYNNVATVLEHTTNQTNYDSNLCALSATGCIVGMLATNNSQGTTPTLDVGDDIGPAAGAGTRTFSTFDAQASSGSYGFEVTVPSTTQGTFHVISFIDSGAVAGSILRQMMMHH